MPCIQTLPGLSNSVLQKSDIVFNEIPTGDLDGSNLFFTTTSKFESGTLEVWIDGRKLTELDFTEGLDSQSFTLLINAIDAQRLNKPPCNDEEIRVSYLKQSQTSGCIINV